jgi:predicted aldo/keto reductase-like oxidoreductase
MRFPRSRNKIDLGKSEQLLLEAIDRGVNYFDTAYVYGGSEEAVGEILFRNKVRDRIFLATKLPHQNCKESSDFDSLFETQLERLKTDRIDYYLIHNIATTEAWQRLCSLGIEQWIEQKKAAGRIGRIGFSFHGAQKDYLDLLDAYDWEFTQIQYNYMDENYQAGRAGLQKAHAKGLPVIIMEPLLGGKLAHGLPATAEHIFKGIDPHMTPASWALRWLFNQPEVTVVLSGMNSPEQLLDNLETAEAVGVGDLKHQEVFPLVKKAIEESYKVPCTGCNYCMPCPNGVNIPGCFSAYNKSFAMGFMAGIQQYLTSTGMTSPAENHAASRCTRCGACEKKCPQNIPISSELKAVAKRMEPFWLSAALKIFMKLR